MFAGEITYWPWLIRCLYCAYFSYYGLFAAEVVLLMCGVWCSFHGEAETPALS